ncbi:hypothetical protein [Rhodoplanes sp. Z2-YC6860]|uniref:hypothetical protein n=1 Tax=Rhodoplanes sp. Z2-YC6860 TaxID=674703 RepID=UPI0012ED7524|nr:hypothetical protein [Rhodoplanes sp. Z2-YC6860]
MKSRIADGATGPTVTAAENELVQQVVGNARRHRHKASAASQIRNERLPQSANEFGSVRSQPELNSHTATTTTMFDRQSHKLKSSGIWPELSLRRTHRSDLQREPRVDPAGLILP